METASERTEQDYINAILISPDIYLNKIQKARKEYINTNPYLKMEEEITINPVKTTVKEWLQLIDEEKYLIEIKLEFYKLLKETIDSYYQYTMEQLVEKLLEKDIKMETIIETIETVEKRLNYNQE